MKTLLLTTIASVAFASSVFAAAELTDENIQALTEALEAQQYAVADVALDGENYSVAASKDGQNMTLIVTDAFEVLEAKPAE